MQNTSTLEIDLPALDANLAAWRKVVGPRCQICPVVKADAYGLGAVAMAKRFAANGVKMVAVYNTAQAAELATAGFPLDLLVLMPVEHIGRTDTLYRSAVAGRLHLTVHSGGQLDRIEAIGTNFGIKMPVHIEVDTGMCRLGMNEDEADAVLAGIHSRKYIRLVGVFSHTAAAGSDVAFTDQQLHRFEALLARHAEMLQGVAIHFAGTCAAFRDTRYHKTMVRLGLGLFGYGDTADEGIPTIDHPPALRPVARWLSKIVHVKNVPAQTSIGYQRSFVTRRPSRIGVVPVGHADGYPVSLSNLGVVRVGPSLSPAPVRGQVNMDQVSIDLTDLPENTGPGTEVELIAADPQAANALPNLAKLAKTNCYELLCRLSPRIPRQYLTKERAG